MKEKKKMEKNEKVEVVEEVVKDEITLLREELELAKEETAKWKNEYYLLYADTENLRKRLKLEHENILKYVTQDLVTSLLPLLDNFERSISVENPSDEVKNFIKGYEMIYNQFIGILKDNNVEVIEAVGKEFDPNFHQAVMQVQDDKFDSNIIVEELQKGYKLKDRVIRPSLVKVNE